MRVFSTRDWDWRHGLRVFANDVHSRDIAAALVLCVNVLVCAAVIIHYGKSNISLVPGLVAAIVGLFLCAANVPVTRYILLGGYLIVGWTLINTTSNMHFINYFNLIVLFLYLDLTVIWSYIILCSAGYVWFISAFLRTSSLHLQIFGPNDMATFFKTDLYIGFLCFAGIVLTFFRYVIASYRRRLEEQEAERLALMSSRQELLASIGQMAASVAHEIRNPLTTVQGFLRMIQDDADMIRYVPLLRTEMDRIGSLVLEMLSLAKNQPTLRLERYLLSPLLAQLQVLQQPAATKRNIRLLVNCPPTAMLFGNARRMTQALLNLIQNAIEVSPVNGTVEVEVELSAEGITVAVSDDGPGLTPGSIDNLFRPFYTTKQNGTGLGLPLAKAIVEEHGGTISVFNRDPHGLTVQMTFPSAVNEGYERAHQASMV